MELLQSITRYMNRKEIEIAHMTAYINKVGEQAAGPEYLAEYNEALRLWDAAKAERDALK